MFRQVLLFCGALALFAAVGLPEVVTHPEVSKRHAHAAESRSPHPADRRHPHAAAKHAGPQKPPKHVAAAHQGPHKASKH